MTLRNELCVPLVVVMDSSVAKCRVGKVRLLVFLARASLEGIDCRDDDDHHKEDDDCGGATVA